MVILLFVLPREDRRAEVCFHFTIKYQQNQAPKIALRPD